MIPRASIVATTSSDSAALRMSTTAVVDMFAIIKAPMVSLGFEDFLTEQEQQLNL
jgi:hypothetical protein